MLGDVNGNYIGAESHLKSSSSAIVFDLCREVTLRIFKILLYCSGIRLIV
ncbi:MAG: hypothetical protein IPO21_19565 [Bacteroidales bacterium]|nr:hypothetical protein [Bacteroidales bacterium]